MASAEARGPVPMGRDAPIFGVMATMRAMRRLRPDPVPDALLRELIEAASWAPSASDLQRYSFVVVMTDKSGLPGTSRRQSFGLDARRH